MSETPIAPPTITVGEDANRPSGGLSGPIVPESPIQLTQPCSAHKCANGHVWPVMLGVAACNGCKAAVAAVKLTNCPICNEPVAVTTLRVEHTTLAVGFQAVCQGVETPAHTHTVEIDLTDLAVGPAKEPEEEPKNERNL